MYDAGARRALAAAPLAILAALAVAGAPPSARAEDPASELTLPRASTSRWETAPVVPAFARPDVAGLLPPRPMPGTEPDAPVLSTDAFRPPLAATALVPDHPAREQAREQDRDQARDQTREPDHEPGREPAATASTATGREAGREPGRGPGREAGADEEGGRRLGVGRATFYQHDGRTASGEHYDPDGLTAAHASLPLGSHIRVVNQETGRSVIVRINDRTNARAQAEHGFLIDLSRGSARAIGIEDVGEVALFDAD